MSEDISDEEVAELNRRNFLKAVGAGVSLSTINLLSEDEAQIGDITYNPQEEVPYVAGWSNEIQDGEIVKEQFYKTVSIDRWEKKQATRSAIQNVGEFLKSTYDSADEYFSIIQTTDEGSPTGRGIEIGVSDEAPYSIDEVEESVPYHVSGHGTTSDSEFELPVGVRRLNRRPQSHGCYDESGGGYELYDDVPAAAPIASKEAAKPATEAGPFWHGDEGIGWITNHHVVDDGSPIGDVVNLLENDHAISEETIGEVSDYVRNGDQLDLAHIRRTVAYKEPHEWIPRIDYTDNEEHAIVGVVSDDELEENEGDSSWNLVSQGHATCRGVGYVWDLEHDLFGNIIGVMMDDDYTDDGDSGGVLYHYDGEDAHICGVVAALTNNDKTYGNTAETAEDEFNGAWLTQ